MQKVRNALTFLNDHTQGGFKKLTQVVNNSNTIRASHYKRVNGQDIEVGTMSQIDFLVCDEPSKVRGRRVSLLFFEECGHNKNLIKSINVGRPLVEIGGQKFGIICHGGTGGEKDAKYMDDLREIFYHPEAYEVLPFRHHYTEDQGEILTGYFIPCYIASYKKEFIDQRGACIIEKAKAYYDEKRAAKADSPQGYIDYCSENCYTPAESFMASSQNEFNKIILTEQLTQIRAFHKGPTIETGRFHATFRNNGDRKFFGGNIEEILWDKINSGKVKILEHPAWLLPSKKDPETDEIVDMPSEKMNFLYVGGIDGIDIGQSQTSRETRSPSDFCMVIKRRTYGMREPQYVALYKDRPDDIEEAYRTAISLAIYYNCQINIEATRMNFVTWAKNHHFLNYLMKRPSQTFMSVGQRNINSYGTPATETIIIHQNTLIKQYVEEFGYNIWFEEILDQLEFYTYEQKRKFDIVVALGMAEIADEELSAVAPKKIQQVDDTFQDFGYYFDENGIRHFGIIPKKEDITVRWNNEYSNFQSYGSERTSNPRYFL